MIPRPPRYTNSEIENVVGRRGGLFWLDDDLPASVLELFSVMNARLDQRVAYAEQHLYSDSDRRISYGFISDESYNAFALASGGEPGIDFVGLNVGMFLTLHETFLRIMADPRSFPSVGDSSLESESASPRPLTTTVLSRPPLPTHPVCEVRAAFATELAWVALDFLFFHEVTHLRNGHCEYVRDRLQRALFVEWVDSLSPDELLIRQTLEFDADCGAILHTLNATIRPTGLLESQRDELHPLTRSVLEAAYRDIETAARTVAYCAYTTFRLFDDTGWDSAALAVRPHPNPAVRMSWIGPALYEVFLQRSEYGYDAREFAKDMAQVVADCEQDVARVQGIEPDPSGIASVYGAPESREYLQRLEATWTTIRPDLLPHVRGGRLPE